MRVLIVDDKLKSDIEKVMAYAEDHQLTMDDLLDMYNGNMEIPGDIEDRNVRTESGYRMVYSIEEQPRGMMKHLSISVDVDCWLPNPVAVEEIMELFGFRGKINDCKCYLEDYGPNRKAINILEDYGVQST